MPKAKWTKH